MIGVSMSRIMGRLPIIQARSCVRRSLSSVAETENSLEPVRTRFAPSPTGFLHLGSLRTALYNYLLAKSTGGKFILRIEDTDQKRLVQGAEQNIFDSLKWCNIEIDEGPTEGGKYGPYRQSERHEIYKKYAEMLVEQGDAYYCECSKERLGDLRLSASKFKPPSTASYDRKCYYNNVGSKGNIIRFRSPDLYEPFEDLLHGTLNLQPQVNQADRRFDDFVIMKSDGLPTYHFANIVDDHLMKITHVIRGEEWLPSTPKHIALYRAFGWTPPKYIHIPLLTSLKDKKLSKRAGDIGVFDFKSKGILPEALVNFVALFGWSPPRLTSGVSTNETMTMDELISSFSLKNLTKGNAKVNDSKLYYFNKQHLNNAIKNPDQLEKLVDDYYPRFKELTKGKLDKKFLNKALTLIGPNISTVQDIETDHSYLFAIEYTGKPPLHTVSILKVLNDSSSVQFEELIEKILDMDPNIKKKNIFQAIRYALAGGKSGLTIPVLIELLGREEYNKRINNCIELCTKCS